MGECIPPPPFEDEQRAVEALQLARLDCEIRKAEHTYDWLMFVREVRSKSKFRLREWRKP